MKILSNVLLVVGSVFLSGMAQAQAPMNVLIGNATANDTQAAANDKFAELITKYSKGRLKASARHGSSLGSNTQMLAALQAGSIQGMDLPAGFMSPIVPDLSLFDLPFLVPGTPANITAFAKQSKAAAQMIVEAGQKGIHIIGFHGIGQQSFLTKFPVSKLADLEGKTFRVIPSPARIGTYQDWGAIARPMALGEIYTALQQGTVGGMEAPADVIYKMKWYEAAPYFTITDHNAFFANVVVSKKWFDALPKDLQNAVTKAGKDAITWDDIAYTKSQESSLAGLRKAARVTAMPAAELTKMKALTRAGIWQRMRNDPKKGPLVKLLDEDVANYVKHSR